MNISDMIDLKRNVSDYLDDVQGLGVITTKQEQKLKNLSEGLDSDIVRGMAQYDKANGTNIAGEFVDVRKRMSERQVQYDKHLKTMFKKSPAKVYGETLAALKAGDADKITAFMSMADDEAKQMLSAKMLQSMGYKDGAFDIKKFSREWGKLADKQAAKDAMFGWDEDLIRQLDGLTDDMGLVLESTRFVDKQGGILSRSIAPVSTFSGAALGGAAGYQDNKTTEYALMGAVLGLAAPSVTARLLSSPEYVGAMRSVFQPGKVSNLVSGMAMMSEVAKRSGDAELQSAHLELMSIVDAAINENGAESGSPEMASSHGGK